MDKSRTKSLKKKGVSPSKESHPVMPKGKKKTTPIKSIVPDDHLSAKSEDKQTNSKSEKFVPSVES